MMLITKLSSFLCKITNPIIKFLDWLTPFFILLARLWISYMFLKSGLLKLESWYSTVMLFTYEFRVPILSPEIAAILATISEILIPSLVILGIGGRISILILFLLNIATVAFYPFLWTTDGLPGLIQHINWGIIIMLLLCVGMGKISLDFLIQKYYHSHKNN